MSVDNTNASALVSSSMDVAQEPTIAPVVVPATEEAGPSRVNNDASEERDAEGAEDGTGVTKCPFNEKNPCGRCAKMELTCVPK